MNTDATPSWSGYIFQGEVALCRAIETINALSGFNHDGFCLRLEEDEDFSIQTDKIEVFQVKANLGKDSDKISKYKSVIEELIKKYYYYKRVDKDPTDGRKRIHTYYPIVRKKPIPCRLITDKFITDYQNDLSDFELKYSVATNFRCIHGEYTTSNIHQKLIDAITTYCANSNLTIDDYSIKVSHCCLNITRIIKERHATKRKERIYFNEIKQWIETPLAFSEDLCWFEISKSFLDFISSDLDAYDLTDTGQAEEYAKVQGAIEEFEKLPYLDLVLLIKYYTTPHKKLDKLNLRQSFGNYLESAAVKSVVLKALREISLLPVFKNLQYTKLSTEGANTRYQLLNHNTDFGASVPQQIKFQKHCEEFYKHPNTIDVDVFVTRNVSKTADDVKSKIINIMDPNATPEDISRRLFSFLTIEETIKELNS